MCRGIRILDFHTNNSEVKFFKMFDMIRFFLLDIMQLSFTSLHGDLTTFVELEYA